MKASGPQRPSGLTFFFPAYNDAGTIASLVIQAVQVGEPAHARFRSDRRQRRQPGRDRQIVEELARTYPQVRAIHHPQQPRLRRRAAHRLRVGNQGAVAYTDGDAQYDPSELEGLWQRLTPETDMVNGLQDQPLRSAAPHRHRPRSTTTW